MATKRERGKCYSCTEQFPRENLKTCPTKAVFLLQLDDDGTEEEGDEMLQILLNSIVGITTEMMQLKVSIHGGTVGALIDSGSTHSFIFTTAARHLSLQAQHQPGLAVTVANGDRMPSLGICKATRIFINQEEFIINLFVIPLEGYNMVLSVHWLRSLGPILWDFKCAHMICWRDDHHVMWHGSTAQRRTAAAQQIS